VKKSAPSNKKSAGWLDSGRIETFMAVAVLAAVLGLFLKFYRPGGDVPSAGPMELQAPATTGPQAHAAAN
jgi:hypothetical protein